MDSIAITAIHLVRKSFPNGMKRPDIVNPDITVNSI